ncbi:MAG TPA: hypothetical protein VGN86_12720 [Pyrinomonadaceae bacterium]|nr:hypothetical protein [Pyrinomonadaceae bacterium]
MKRLLAIIALTCLLSVSAMAGDIPTVGGATPAPGDVPSVGIAATIVLTIIRFLPR